MSKKLWVQIFLIVVAVLFSVAYIVDFLRNKEPVQTATTKLEKSSLTQPNWEKLPVPKTKEDVEFEARMQGMKDWAKEHVSAAEKRCAAYKKKVYSSDIDPQVKDLLWGAAVVASEYCWQVDTPKPKPKK